MASAQHSTLISNVSYVSQARITVGMVAGFVASLAIMVVVGAVLLITGHDIWTAARLVATSVFGTQTDSGWLPVVAGTLIHLLTGTVFGAIFARFVPRMPANIYVLAGILYGLLTFSITGFVILPLVAPLMVATEINLVVLLLAQIIYGFVLGIAGAYVELLWNLPKRAGQ